EPPGEPERRPARGWLSVQNSVLAHRQRNTFASPVHFEHGHFDLLLHFDHVVDILDEAVCELTDVHQPVLVDTNVDEGAKGGDVGHHAAQLHPRPNVVERVHAFGEAHDLEHLARIAARL